MKLCVALDMSNLKKCLKLANIIKDYDLWVKIGMRSFYRDGIKLIKELKELKFKIFLDLKLYDIPNTMSKTCEELANLNIDMINLHASAGKSALKECMKSLNNLAKRPLVLGVSALTSFDEVEFYEVYKQNINEAIISFSKLCYESGLDGMVCSAWESKIIKENTKNDFVTLCPGIRPYNEAQNDQKRIANIQDAKNNLADFIVIGRPIYTAKNPKAIINQILKDI